MSYYEILKVNIDDDLSVIQQSYITLLKIAKQSNLDISLLNKAYNTLKNPHSRVKYDHELLNQQYLKTETYNPEDTIEISLTSNQTNATLQNLIFSQNQNKINDTFLPKIENINPIISKQLNIKLQDLIFSRCQDDIENTPTQTSYDKLNFEGNQCNIKDKIYNGLVFESDKEEIYENYNKLSKNNIDKTIKQNLSDIDDKYENAKLNKNWNELQKLRDEELINLDNLKKKNV